MRKAHWWIILAVLLFLAGCAADQEDPQAKYPTGYPSGQVQRSMVFYNGTLYVLRDGGGRDRVMYGLKMKQAAKVESVDNSKLPSEELAAAHLSVGDKIMLLQEDGEEKLFVQMKGSNRVWELEAYEPTPEEIAHFSK